MTDHYGRVYDAVYEALEAGESKESVEDAMNSAAEAFRADDGADEAA